MRGARTVRLELVGDAHGEFDAKNAADANRFACRPESHDATHLVMVGDGERRIAQLSGSLREGFGERGTIEERERGMAVQFRVNRGRAGHCAGGEWTRI